PVVPAHRQLEVATRDPAAIVGQQTEVDDPADQPAGDDAEGPQDGDAEEQGDHRDGEAELQVAGVEGRGDDVVGRPAEDPGVGHRQRAEDEAADHREAEQSALLAHADVQDRQAPRGGSPAWPIRTRGHLTSYPAAANARLTSAIATCPKWNTLAARTAS